MIIDVNEDVTSVLGELKLAGVDGIIGYLNPLGMNAKVMTKARAQAIADAGMTLALVSEGWGDFVHGGISAGAGERDALAALREAEKLGLNVNSGLPCIYFAVDTDASISQVNKLVLPYFAAIMRVFDSETKCLVGVYGSGAVCSAVLAAKSANMSWLACSMGWRGSVDFLASKIWTLRQHVPSVVAGVHCDVDETGVPGAAYGAFRPFTAVQVAITEAPPTEEQKS